MNPPRQSVLILIVADLSPRSSRYTRVGARMGDLDLSVFVDNITNEFAVIGANHDVNALRYYTARPRTIGFGASMKF